MKNTFRISELAKMHDIPTKTLRYYHEIGLFVPAIIDEKNGYRYYTVEQFERLSTIRYLRYQGISLKDIKDHLDNKDVDSFITLLEEQRAITDAKMKELQRIRDRFDIRIQEIKEFMEIPRPHHICILEKPRRMAYHLKERITSESELEYSLRKLVNQYGLNTDLIIGKVVLTVSKENIMKGIYDEYEAINVIMEENVHDYGDLHILEAGLYAYSYHQGGHEVSGKYYKILKSYLKNNGYRITGDAYERIVINEYISSKKEDYLTEIQIPISR